MPYTYNDYMNMLQPQNQSFATNFTPANALLETPILPMAQGPQIGGGTLSALSGPSTTAGFGGQVGAGAGGGSFGAGLGSPQVGAGLGQGFTEGISPLPALAGAYGTYNILGDLGTDRINPASGAIRGAASGAALGSAIGAGPIGGIIGGLTGLLAGAFGGGGLSAEEKKRNAIKKALRQKGLITENNEIQLADGTYYRLSDQVRFPTAESGIKGETTGTNISELPDKPFSQSVLDATDLLAFLITGEQIKPDSEFALDFSGQGQQITAGGRGRPLSKRPSSLEAGDWSTGRALSLMYANAAMSNADTEDAAMRNVFHFFKEQMGVQDWIGAANYIIDSFNNGKITAEQYNRYAAAWNRFKNQYYGG